MRQWEYCLVKQHKVDEIWFLSPTGEKKKFNSTLAGVLKWLGDNGWEAVNYTSEGISIDNAFSTWPRAAGGLIAQVALSREILLKRPIGE